MNRNEILAKREERAKLYHQANALFTKEGVTADEKRSASLMLDDVDRMGAEITAAEKDEARFSSLQTEFRGNGAPPSDSINRPAGGDDPATVKAAQDRHHRAWVNSMKYGMSPKMTSQGKRIMGCSDEDRRILLTGMDSAMASNVAAPELRGLTFNEYAGEQRDMGSGGQGAYPGATSGFFIPVGFTNRIEDALKYYGPMLNGGPGMPEIFDTATGQPLPFPTDNDTTISGELIGEGQQVSSVDVSLSQVMLGAYKYSSKLVKVSLELLQDSAFDLESFLVKKFATRTGRILNNHFTVGTGTAQPKGIVVASTVGFAAIGSASNDGTGASTNTIGSDDLIGLEHSVDPLYRPGAKYMFHDATLRALRQVKDKYGRPLWQPGLAVNAPDIINGYGYAINNDMDQLQTQATSPVVVRKTVLFGQLPKYMIRRVKDMQVLRLEERFADYGQVAFIMFSRFDGTLLDAGTNPVKYLSNSY